MPYIGYFQLLSCVDAVVFLDDVKFSKGGWVNRNRIQIRGVERYLTVPIERASSSLTIAQRRVSSSFDRNEMKQLIKNAYGDAPEFERAIATISAAIDFGSKSLFEYVVHSVKSVMSLLDIDIPTFISSQVLGDVHLRGQDRVVAICRALGAATYINQPNGRTLYSHAEFERNQIQLLFIDPKMETYDQKTAVFIPSLSIIDVLMYNELELITSTYLSAHTLSR